MPVIVCNKNWTRSTKKRDYIQYVQGPFQESTILRLHGVSESIPPGCDETRRHHRAEFHSMRIWLHSP
jgi:hypothetical protein